MHSAPFEISGKTVFLKKSLYFQNESVWPAAFLVSFTVILACDSVTIVVVCCLLIQSWRLQFPGIPCGDQGFWGSSQTIQFKTLLLNTRLPLLSLLRRRAFYQNDFYIWFPLCFTALQVLKCQKLTRVQKAVRQIHGRKSIKGY